MGKKNVSIPLKWQIVGLLKSGDKKQNEIAKLLGVSPKCVSSTKKRYEETGSVSDRSRSGRPRKLSFRDENYIFREIRKDPTLSYQKLATDFNSKTQGVRISKYTVMRFLKKKGLESHTAVRKPLLTLKDRLKRYKWCKQRLNWTVNDWSRVIFSDESNFEVLNRKSRVIVKRFKNEKFHPKFCIPRLQNGGGSAGIWGCISYKGTGICNIYTGRINQFVYINTLENNLLPSVELLFEPNDTWIFQQDGASAHTAHSVSDWFKEQNIEVLPWCARSPDLNPIENLWSYMDAKMVNTKVTSIEHLKDVLHKEWLKIPTEYVQKLIESMPKRVLACYNAKGGHFKY